MAASKLLLDANVLLLLVIGLVDPAFVSKFKRTQEFTAEDFQLLLAVIGEATIVSTPHVLAEVSNFAGKLTGSMLAKARLVMKAQIEIFEEEHVPAKLAVESVVFARLGLTEAAIAQLAPGKELRVVTTDLDLYLHLDGVGVEATNFNHLRAEYFGY